MIDQLPDDSRALLTEIIRLRSKLAVRRETMKLRAEITATAQAGLSGEMKEWDALSLIIKLCE